MSYEHRLFALRRRPGIPCRAIVGIAAAVCVLASGLALRADEGPTTLEGEAVLAHPAGRAVLEAARLLAAGKLAEVKSRSTEEVRAEWAATSADEQREEVAMARQRAPDPETFGAEIRRSGVLTLYEDSATLRLPTADDEVSAMAFVVFEGGAWRVTSGPMTFAPAPVETAPPLLGEAILAHPIGKLAVEYARRLESGRVDTALELLSGPARAKRAAESSAERRESDAFRLRHLPAAAQLVEQIRDGGRLSFAGEAAFLNVVSNLATRNADGSTSFASTSTVLPFEQQDGEWRIAD